MISDRKTLQLYLDADRFALGIPDKIFNKSRFPVWRFEILLRKCEFLKNTGSSKIIYAIYLWRFRKLSKALGFNISLNCFGPGLRINHYGLLVINSKTIIGKWCDIHQGVCIGDNGYISDDGHYIAQVPSIGDYVYIGPGAKIFGDIHIGNSVRISANAVVSINIENEKTVMGCPTNQIVATHHSNRNLIASKSFEERFLAKYPEYREYLCDGKSNED